MDNAQTIHQWCWSPSQSKRLTFVEDYRCRLQVAWMWGRRVYSLRPSRNRVHTFYIVVTPRRDNAPPKAPGPGQSSLRVANAHNSDLPNVDDAHPTFHPSSTHYLRTLSSPPPTSRSACSSSMIRSSALDVAARGKLRNIKWTVFGSRSLG